MVPKATNVSGGEMSFFISVPSDVKPGSKVVFSVRAFTSVGPGPAKNMSVQIIQFGEPEMGREGGGDLSECCCTYYTLLNLETLLKKKPSM